MGGFAGFAIVAFELDGDVMDVELLLEQIGHVAQHAVLIGREAALGTVPI